MDDNRNTILAILLSIVVLVGWQYFVGMPQVEKQKEAQKEAQKQTQMQQPGTQQPGQPAAPGSGSSPQVPGGSVSAPPAPGGYHPHPVPPRDEAARELVGARAPNPGAGDEELVQVEDLHR